MKLREGLSLLVSAHHFLIYARQVADELERDCVKARRESGHYILKLHTHPSAEHHHVNLQPQKCSSEFHHCQEAALPVAQTGPHQTRNRFSAQANSGVPT